MIVRRALSAHYCTRSFRTWSFMAMGGVQMLVVRFCSAQAVAVPSHSSASGDAEQGLPIDVRRAALVRANSCAAE